ncbi:MULTISPECIES: hypothetical protein [Acinetobacter]|uniref:Uncharacterized protein n=1 Tax=Acinetobacter indicus TaxID=756892 RepID=A0A6C0Y6J9_9GAMM|nr:MULTISPECIES: hypothetical protein [Acinetobacter]QIC71871.1 hypothetical protein FSC09_15895 [Acinetobacter indicus]QKQ71407.1 hypothetical protein E5Y90_14345 [Acinetobacter sp. 10FS3-1]
MQKSQEELAMEFVNEIVATDYMDGVFYFFEQQKFDLLTSYSIDENDNEVCTSKLAVIGDGLLTLINSPDNELILYFGAVTWDRDSPFIDLTTNAELILNHADLDECSIAFEYLKEALENHDILEIHLLHLMAYFNNHSEYFLEYSGYVMPETYELTDRSLEEQFKTFIKFLDTRVVPKLKFED